MDTISKCKNSLLWRLWRPGVNNLWYVSLIPIPEHVRTCQPTGGFCFINGNLKPKWHIFLCRFPWILSCIYGIFPEKSKKGLIVKIPKRRDLKECKSWRGVTLLAVASKVMGRVIIERIQNGVDHILRKEQAGFRKNNGTIDQIFILLKIIRQVSDFQAIFYVHFVEFEKAFDSVHRKGLWRIMKAYSIPD